MPFLSGVNTNSSYTSKGLPATYSITQDVLSAKEGQSVVFTITTTNVRDGAKLFWTTSGNVAGADFVGSALTGNVTVINNTATITRTLAVDGLTDPSETFSIVVRTSSIVGKVVATSAAITIAPSITITPNVTTISEGDTITFTITGTDLVNPAMTVYWSIVPVSGVFDAADMTAAFTGSSVLSSSAATFSRVLTNDVLTEPTVESFRADLYSDAGRTILMASSAVVTVTDTSKTVGYSMTASTTSVNEGGSVTFNITTENLPNTTLYWTLSGTSTTVAADFSGSAVSGSFTTTNNAGSFTRTMVADLALEGQEQFTILIRTTSISGPIVLTSDTIIVNDTSVPTYTITPSASSVNEGSAVSFTVNTTGVANGTVLYWNTNAVSGTVDASDFSDALLTGTVTINTNTGSLSRTLTSDLTTEGIETFQVRLYTDSGRTNLVATSSTVTINDTSLTRTYAIAPGVTSINEGGSVTFTVTTTNFGSGTLYWDTSGTMAAADFTGAVLTGSVTVTANTGTISRTLASDLTLEGTETFALRLYTDVARTVLVATSATVTVNDTSVPTYTITPSASSVNEGSAVTFTVTTAGVANGTILYWNTNAVSGTVDASDFSDALLIGTVTINTSTGSISRTLVADLTTEGIETFQIRLYTDSGRTNLVATSTTVTINDTSLTRTYAIAPGVTSINEGGSVTFTVTTTNFGSGTLYWDTSGTMTAADFTGAVLTGSVTITTNSGTISRTLSADVTTEGSETFALRLYTDVARTILVATSATVTVNDTSLAPVYNSISQDVTTVNEGGSVAFTISTSNVPNGTTLYWNTTVVSGTVAASDFSDALLSGSFTINSNTGTVTRTLSADTSTEGTESFQLTIRTGSITGTVVMTSATVTVNDTSLTQVWAVTPNVASVNEGGSVVFTISTSNVPNGTYYWTTGGTTVAADFSDATVSGSFTLTNNTGSVTRTLSNDLVTEGAQTITLSARITSISGTVRATSSSVTVNDTSLTPPGQILYTTTQIGSATFQTYSWVVPGGVSSISVVCIGGGGGGASGTTQWGAGGGGGALAYTNNLAVTAGETITVRVGAGGTGFNVNTTTASNTGGISSILRGSTYLNAAAGGTGGFTVGAATTSRQGRGGTVASSTGTVRWQGGDAGNVQNVSGAGISGAGGAAGYSGAGGAGGSLMTSASPVNATASTGGGGGGGGYKSWIIAGSRGGRGGNVGALGAGANGAAGTNMTTSGVNTPAGDGGNGSGGGYGGGGAGGYNVTTLTLLHGTPGAVRIMWPGNARSYPSTRVASE